MNESESTKDAGQLVRRIREMRGLTQEGLARELGVSFATVNGWENGRHRPIPLLARRLAELAGEARDIATEVPGKEIVGARSTAELEATTGWLPHDRERRDFYHRPREFPRGVTEWRTRMVERAMTDATTFPLAVLAGRRASSEAGGGREGAQAAVERTRELVDEGISFLREIARLVAILHGTPRLGNKPDPLDELVYIALSRKTREQAYQEAYDALKRRFRRWDDLLEAPAAEVESLLSGSGLGGKKTLSLRGALAMIKERFGRCTLAPLRNWENAEVEAFLCSLPEISRKSAYCIMMYSFDREVLPVDTHVGRVLSRLGPYRELGLDLEGKDHKQLQAILADLAPPNLRYSLHVNLLVHGREICTAQRPACERCDLKGFCGYYRAAENARVRSMERPRTVDLFTGAGGLSEGFERAGFEVAAAVDMDPVALRTYRLNHPAVDEKAVVCKDVRLLQPGELKKLAGRRRVDVLIGAPPCQGFSHVGQRSKSTLTGYRVTEDARNFLYENMIAAARELKPKLFLMENVPGMSSAKNGEHSFLDAAANALRAEGFTTATWKLSAAAYGVPQERVRHFLVAARGVPLPELPPAVYRNGVTGDYDHDALPTVTLDEAIFDLPERAADDGLPVDVWSGYSANGSAKGRRYVQKFGLLSTSRLLYNHTVRYHNERDLELYGLLRPGEDSVHALERHKRSDLMRYRSDVFDDKYARLRGDRPCKTIVSHLAKDGNGYIHPTQTRSLSLREAARVQSFRDDYVFCGSPSDQWVHLGNAVPPLLAETIARSFMIALGEKKK